jgi:cell division septation protein DedD
MAAAPRALTPPSPPAPAYHYSEPELPEPRIQHVYSVNDYESMIGQHAMPQAETTSLSNSRRSSATSSRRSSLNTAARLSVQETSRQSVKPNGNVIKSKPVVQARAIASEWIGDDFDSAHDMHVSQPINSNKPKHVPARGRAIAAANAINNSPKHARHVGLKAKSNTTKAKVVEVDVSSTRDAKPVVQLGGLVNTNSGFSRFVDFDFQIIDYFFKVSCCVCACVSVQSANGCNLGRYASNHRLGTSGSCRAALSSALATIGPGAGVWVQSAELDQGGTDAEHAST